METVCDDELDDDQDGLIDCEDNDCDGEISIAANGFPFLCEAGSELSCDDGFDNDGDGEADCDDTD